MLPEPSLVEPGDIATEAMRRHLDRLNRQFVSLSDGIRTIDDQLREIIFDQLDAIGLDNLNQNRT